MFSKLSFIQAVPAASPQSSSIKSGDQSGPMQRLAGPAEVVRCSLWVLSPLEVRGKDSQGQSPGLWNGRWKWSW